MTFWRLIRRSLRFHARSHLGVVLGATIGSAVLIGALVVGDSVKESLRQRAFARLGNIEWALQAEDRTLTAQLVHKWQDARKQSGNLQTGGQLCGLLVFSGTAKNADGTAAANRTQIIGVDEYFNTFSGEKIVTSLGSNDVVVLNKALASQLAVVPGDEVILHVHRPALLSQEIAVSPRSTVGEVFRLRVQAIASASELGDYSLSPQSTPTLNVFVSLAVLQRAVGIDDRINQILVASATADAVASVPVSKARGWSLLLLGKLTGKRYVQDGGDGRLWKDVSGSANSGLDRSLRLRWKLADAELQLTQFTDLNALELRSPRVFVPTPLSRAVESPIDWNQFFLCESRQAAEAMISLYTNYQRRAELDLLLRTNVHPLITYFANLLRSGTNTTPYSMVTAAGAPWTPTDMRDDEFILNQWLAEDLQAKPGDEISLVYFDPESGARLIERTNTFRVRGIVPMEMPWADRTLMPDFPGIEKAESTSDWDAGFPLVHKIRQKDEDYWKKYRGTPKAFVTLAAGKKMWANRFGELTAIRFPIPTNILSEGRVTRAPESISRTNQGVAELHPPMSVEEFRATLEKKILANLKPEELGLHFEPVREQALKAAEQSQDFGQLFLGFSFFIIIAALVLMALLFQFGLEQRTSEIGTLLALGFTQKQVRKLLLREEIILSLIGGALGALGGIFYAKAMLHALTTVWRDAIGNSSLQFHTSPKSLLIGFCASTVVASLVIWLTLRKQAKRPARELLANEFQVSSFEFPVGRTKFAGLIALFCVAGAASLIGWAILQGETTNAEIFFSAGALVLITGLALTAAWLRKLSEGGALRSPKIKSETSQGVVELRPPITGVALAVRSCARRRKRSLATIAMLACGSFLIVAVSAFRLDSNQNATKRTSGTGSFALIGETTMPVVHDLNSSSGRDFFVLNEKDLAGVNFVPFRVREGDDASCLNLNRAQKPRLLGVKPELLDERFRFARQAEGVIEKQPWLSLKRDSFYPKYGQQLGENEVAAIGDANSIQWALGKKVGDIIDYTDERGNVFKLRLVGAVANSILQGSLLIDESEFVKRFPNESGYKFFLIDAPTNRVTEVSATLSRAMEDVGLELTPAVRRLNEFNAVQNTYLGTFQILGGLGLLLGSAGLGIVVLRNVLERRGELALLAAVGFQKRALQWMLLSEHGAMLALGLGIGILAATVAILPSLISPSADIPFVSVVITLGAVLLNGGFWTWLATRFALRGNLLSALRNE